MRSELNCWRAHNPAAISPDCGNTRGLALVLAVAGFEGSTPNDRRMAYKMARIIARDLKRDGRFVLVDSSIVERASVNMQPRFADWTALKVQGLITGRIVNHRHKLTSEVRLWGVAESEQPMGQSYVSESQAWRRIAHSMADSVYELLTRENSRFEDR